MNSSPLITRNSPGVIALCLTTALLFSAATASAELPPHMMELDAQLTHQNVLIGEPQEVFATVDLQALEVEVDERPVMNLALVIDSSGSMRGQKIVQARQAALHVVDSLTKKDRLTIVTYSNEAQVVVDSMLATSSNRETMRAAIERISEGGSTNMSAGYEAGVDIVKTHHDENRVNRVLHFSDGHATHGITDPDQLRALSRRAYDNGVSTTSIGFGLNYNERLMTGMAVEGSGNYYFVNNGDDLGVLVAREMTGLSATVANRIEVILDPGHGVEIVDVFGFNQRYRDDKVVVSLSEMAAGQNRSITVRLSVVAQSSEPREILGVRANYRDAVNDRHRYREEITRVAVTDSQAVVDRTINHDVMTRAEQVRMAQNIDSAMEQYSAGNQQGASDMLAAEQRRSRSVRRQYNMQESEFEEMDSDYDRIGRSVRARPADAPESREMQMESSEVVFDLLQTR